MASVKAAGLAVKEGYQNVYVFRGGLPEWIMAGYPTVSLENLPRVDVPTMSVHDLKQKLDAGEDFVLLDVRIPVDAAKYRLETPLLLHISLNDLPKRYSEIPTGKSVVIFDKIGTRSSLASRYLSSKGFEDLVKVSGGMNQWIRAGYPTKVGK